jgi:hypothetical protein
VIVPRKTLYETLKAAINQPSFIGSGEEMVIALHTYLSSDQFNQLVGFIETHRDELDGRQYGIFYDSMVGERRVRSRDLPGVYTSEVEAAMALGSFDAKHRDFVKRYVAQL